MVYQCLFSNINTALVTANTGTLAFNENTLSYLYSKALDVSTEATLMQRKGSTL